jgi:hypothetical protein
MVVVVLAVGFGNLYCSGNSMVDELLHSLVDIGSRQLIPFAARPQRWLMVQWNPQSAARCAAIDPAAAPWRQGGGR